jgi:hypothetical protein
VFEPQVTKIEVVIGRSLGLGSLPVGGAHPGVVVLLLPPGAGDISFEEPAGRVPTVTIQA